MIRELLVLWAVSLGNGTVAKNTKQNGEHWLAANQCADIQSRIERLQCFDTLFKPSAAQVVADKRNAPPRSWQLAMETFKQQPDALSQLVIRDEQDKDAWLILRSRFPLEGQDEKKRPALVLSCVNNLSRVELALPAALDHPRVKISVAYGPTQYWRSDDSGYLYSSAQGLPAIEMMKVMARTRPLNLRSNIAQLDKLHFDVSALNQSIDALRKRCGW